MNRPDMPSRRPTPTTAERWEYIVLAGSNRVPEEKADGSALDLGLRMIASTQALVFLSAVLAVVALAPQTPGAHNWAAERAAQQAAPAATGSTAGATP